MKGMSKFGMKPIPTILNGKRTLKDGLTSTWYTTSKASAHCPTSRNNKTASVPFVTARLRSSQDGIAIIWSGEVTAAKIRQTIASFSTQNVMSDFIVKG